MSQAHSAPLARVLAAPWQQRRNAGSPWGLAFIVLACSGFPIVLFALSVLGDPGQSDFLRHKAALSAWVGIGALLVVGWAMLVGNVLQQNQPTLARLVPRHVERLRGGLLIAWAVLILAATAGPGYALDAPLACACGAAGALALFAAVLRWPVLLVAGMAAPFVTAFVLNWDGHAALGAALASQWRSADWLITCIVVTAGALTLVAIVREDGRGPRACYEAGHGLGRLLATRPASACAPATGRLARPYAWWMARLLARRDSAVASRLLLGFGPQVHWMTRIHDSLWFVLVGGGICAVVVALAAFLGRDLRGVLPWLSFSLLTGACTPALQAVGRLYRLRGEQALLALLPGVPRGARLNRWLAWQMSALFLGSALWGLALAGAIDAFAQAVLPGGLDRTAGGLTQAIAAALLPQVAWQWRSWARQAAGASSELLPSLAPFAAGAAAMLLHAWTGTGYLAIGAVLATASGLLCAWRWWRMGSEPSALPMGRLAR